MTAPRADDPNLSADLIAVAQILAPFLGGGLLAMLLFGLSCDPGQLVATFGTALAVATAAGVAGGLFGLLFGVPRALSQVEAGAGATPPETGSRAAPRGYGGNTNLEQISDWLTKVLVGATLVQLGTLSSRFGRLTAQVAAGFCHPNSEPFAGGLLLGAFIWGFFLGYLMTRRALPGLLRRGEAAPPFTDEDRATVKAAAVIALDRSTPPAAGSAPPSPAISAAARKITSIPLTSLRATDFGTWGQAQILQKNFARASQALEGARAANPGDPETVEALMFSSLYQPPPEGFRRAIDVGENFSPKTGRLNAYLAAAYGQKHRWEKDRNPASPALKDLRDKAVAFAKAALLDSPEWRSTLEELRKPPPGSVDNDLASLADDAELTSLLARGD